jgi:hypothetical protein
MARNVPKSPENECGEGDYPGPMDEAKRVRPLGGKPSNGFFLGDHAIGRPSESNPVPIIRRSERNETERTGDTIFRITFIYESLPWTNVLWMNFYGLRKLWLGSKLASSAMARDSS